MFLHPLHQVFNVFKRNVRITSIPREVHTLANRKSHTKKKKNPRNKPELFFVGTIESIIIWTSQQISLELLMLHSHSSAKRELPSPKSLMTSLGLPIKCLPHAYLLHLSINTRLLSDIKVIWAQQYPHNMLYSSNTLTVNYSAMFLVFINTFLNIIVYEWFKQLFWYSVSIAAFLSQSSFSLRGSYLESLLCFSSFFPLLYVPCTVSELYTGSWVSQFI